MCDAGLYLNYTMLQILFCSFVTSLLSDSNFNAKLKNKTGQCGTCNMHGRHACEVLLVIHIHSQNALVPKHEGGFPCRWDGNIALHFN